MLTVSSNEPEATRRKERHDFLLHLVKSKISNERKRPSERRWPSLRETPDGRILFSSKCLFSSITWRQLVSAFFKCIRNSTPSKSFAQDCGTAHFRFFASFLK